MCSLRTPDLLLGVAAVDEQSQEHALREARRVLERYVSRHRMPAPPVSSVYSAQTPPARQEYGSQQERWVERHADDLGVEKVWRGLSRSEQDLILYRYAVGPSRTWVWVAKQIHVSREKALRMHREILRLIAHELGLTKRSA